MTTISDERLADAEWLEQAARYFEKRDTGGEDMAFWANVANAERCRSIAQSLRAQGGVRVKALEWEQIGDNHWRADTAFGPWEVCAQPMFGKSWRTFSPTGWKTYHGDDPEKLKRLSEQELSKRILSSIEASPDPVSEHPDDLAVDRFAAAMKAKLAKKREEGRGGWESKDECSAEFLSQLLREHVEKGDPLDVGNLAMMLHQRGDAISPDPVSELSGQDLQLLGQLNRDNVWDGARPVLEGPRSDPDTDQAFRLSEQGYIALEQGARGVRLHITRKGVAVLSAAKGHVPEPAPVSEKMVEASCPGCRGTGDQGGNPSYGVCDDCSGTGKVGQPLPAALAAKGGQ